MSAVPSSVDSGLTNLTPELTRSSENSVNIAKAALNVTNDKLAISSEKVQQQIDEAKKSTEEIATKQPLTAVQLEKVAQQLQDFVGEMNRGLEFLVDKDSGRDVIKVIDKSTGDLVKQFPSEEVLTLVAKLSEMVGGFIDAKV